MLNLTNAVVVAPGKNGKRYAGYFAEDLALITADGNGAGLTGSAWLRIDRPDIRFSDAANAGKLPEITDKPVPGRPFFAIGTRDELEGLPQMHLIDRLPRQDREGYRLISGLDPAGVPFVIACGTDARGVLYGFGRILRNVKVSGGQIFCEKNMIIATAPAMPVRGHQLGYRDRPNSYDAWTPEQFERYFRDMAIFGVNFVELFPPNVEGEKRGYHMLYDPTEMLIKTSAAADRLGLSVSVWYPNRDSETAESMVADREDVFSRVPRIDTVFIPGGDPGKVGPEELFLRGEVTAKVLKKYHPDARVWISAQRPKRFPGWTEGFFECINKEPEWLGGLIHGPNQACSLAKLSEVIAGRYPIRLYEDITHNIRCQFPVNHPYNDWHYAFAGTSNRESYNPRPAEYARTFKEVSAYSVGSVTYSEGINDDVNKMAYSDQLWSPGRDVRETLREYGRVFFPGVCEDAVADGILGIERNWLKNPAENEEIEKTFVHFMDLARKNVGLDRDWRFQMALFRTTADTYVRRRLVRETPLVPLCYAALKAGDTEKALEIASTPNPADEQALLSRMWDLAEELFKSIGMQLDVQKYHGESWERGCVLETINQPVTELAWIANRIAYIKTLPEERREDAYKAVAARSDVSPRDRNHSFALHGHAAADDLEGRRVAFYYDCRGDFSLVNKDGLINPRLYRGFNTNAAGFRFDGMCDGAAYELTAFYYSDMEARMQITANGAVLHDGNGLGGDKDEFVQSLLCPPGFQHRTYHIPKGTVKNGVLRLSFFSDQSAYSLSEIFVREKCE